MSKRKASGLALPAKKKMKKLAAHWADYRTNDDRNVMAGPDAIVLHNKGKAAERQANGRLRFADAKEFEPRLTPKQIIEAGAFGGCYFRPIKSGVLGKSLSDQHKEFDFFKDVPDSKLCLEGYDSSVNAFGVTCGGSLAMWESKGWISPLDPYGWFQWYCRFFSGRRSEDDERQIGRWQRCCGPKGRWRQNLVTKVVRKGTTFDDVSVSPVVRQTLLHWGYDLCEEDFEIGKKRVK